jgi:membrane-associated phospholipid phosphatase
MTSRSLWWSGVGAVLAAVALGGAVVFGHTGPPGPDPWWNATLAGHRADWMISSALALDHLGGGWVAVLVVPLLVIVPLLLLRRPWAALFAAASFLAGAGAVQLLKNVYGRARPDDMLVTSDFGSFPSGHVANAATIAVVLYVLFPRAWVAAAGAAWTGAMALSRTLLSVHWATDVLGGALLGSGVALLLAAWALPHLRPARGPFPARAGTDDAGSPTAGP